MPSYAVVGASRGIGLEYVRQLVSRSTPDYVYIAHALVDIRIQAARPDSIVFAVVRNAANSKHLQAAIQGLKNVHVLEADVADYRSLEVPYAPSGVVTAIYMYHRARRKRRLKLLEGSSTV